MNKTNLEYIISLMQDQPEMRFFKISDSSDNVVYDQQNENTDTAKAIDCLQNFFKHNEGIYTIQLRNKRIKTGNGYRELGIYTIVNNQEYSKAPINGIDQPQTNYSQFGNSSDIQRMIETLQKKDERIQELIHSNFLAIMAERDKMFQLQMEAAKKENANPNAAFDSAALQAITGLFGGGGMTTINGLGDAPVNTMELDRDKLNRSIQKLLKVDPNFVANIEKLANLATSKPGIYKMAIDQLNSL